MRTVVYYGFSINHPQAWLEKVGGRLAMLRLFRKVRTLFNTTPRLLTKGRRLLEKEWASALSDSVQQTKRTITWGHGVTWGVSPAGEERREVLAIDHFVEGDVGGGVEAFGWGGDDAPR